MKDVEPEAVEWLWQDRIPLGKLTVLEGDPGLGKSTLTLNIIAQVTTGGPLPGDDLSREPENVVIVSYEDGLGDTLRPRLDAARADVTRVHVIQGYTPTDKGEERLIRFPDDAGAVFDAVRQLRARLVVIDPLGAALSGETDSYKDADVRRALAPIARFAEDTGAAVLVVRHLTKGAGRAIVAGGGSIGIAAAARSVLAVHADPDKPDDPFARVLATVKSNLAPLAPSLAFRLVSEPGAQAARIEWGATSHRTADALSALRADSGESGDAEREVDEWLRSALSAGPLDRKAALQQGTDAGFSTRSIDRAANRLSVERSQAGFGPARRSEWRLPCLPTERGVKPQSSNPAHVSIYGSHGKDGADTSPPATEELSF